MSTTEIFPISCGGRQRGMDKGFNGNYPGNYLNSFRYRSISFENKIGVARSTENIDNIKNECSAIANTRKSQHYGNFNNRQNRRNINLGCENPDSRSNEFEKIYKESIEGVLKTPPISNIGNKSSLKATSVYGNNRRSLAENIRINPSYKGDNCHIEVNSNSKSDDKLSYFNKPTFKVLAEKDIPEEGNARRPDRHRTKMNDFNGTALKLKMRKDRNLQMVNLKSKPNNSYDHVQKYEFKETESISYKQKLIESKENRQVKTKRNLDENIEPDGLDKFGNIKSSENFCPGRAKVENNEDENSVWNFWNTLKNPLQWFGLNKESDNQVLERSNGSEDLSDNLSQRNRSISYHAQKSNKESFRFHPDLPQCNFRFPKSNEKLKYQNFAKVFRQVHEPTISRE